MTAVTGRTQGLIQRSFATKDPIIPPKSVAGEGQASGKNSLAVNVKTHQHTQKTEGTYGGNSDMPDT